MLSFISSLTRKQKAYILLSIDLALIPLALLFTYTVQSLPTTPVETLFLAVPILPYLLIGAAGLSMWLGIPYIQLNAYERHAVGLTAIFSMLMAGASALLSGVAGMALPPGTHVMFGIIYFLMSVASRMVLYQVVTGIYRRAQPRRRVMIYGAGTTGAQLAQARKHLPGASFVNISEHCMHMQVRKTPEGRDRQG